MYKITGNTDLKLFHFCFALDPELAGVAKAVTNLCLQTSKFGITHQVASFGNSNSSRKRGRIFIDDLEKQEIQVISGGSAYTNQYGFGSFLFGLKLLWTHPRTDAIVLHQLYTFSTLWGWAVGRIHSIPLLLLPHGTLTLYHEKDSKLKKFIAKKLILNKVIRDCELLIATSDPEKKDIEKLTGKPVAVISYGLESKFEGSHSNYWTNPNLLFVGRFTQKKNLDKLIKAIKILQPDYPEIRLKAVGYRITSEIENLRQLISGMDLEKFVELVPWATDVSLESYYKSADVFVLASENENFGLVVADALSYGLPCVVSKDVALSTHIQGGNAGIVITYSMPETISDGIKNCLDSSFLERKANARLIVRQELSWERVSQLWKQTVDELRI